MNIIKKTLAAAMAVVLVLSCFVITGSAASNKDRYSVLVLDVSGSMEGTPIEELKKGAVSFCDYVISSQRNRNKVAIVTFETNVKVISDFSNDLDMLAEKINSIQCGDMTNLGGGLEKAKELLDAVSGDVIRNIVVMCDGLPNQPSWQTGASYAYNVVQSIPLFWNIYGLYYCQGGFNQSAEDIMKQVGRNEYAKVETGTELEFSFIDNGTTITTKSVNKVIIHIACPVDVSVTLNGVTLNRQNPETMFGTLTFEGNGKDEEKILTLAYRDDYVIEINGYDEGTMDYSIQYFCNDDELYNLNYPTTKVTSTTKITTGVDIDNSKMTLDVDSDGDGVVDQKVNAMLSSTSIWYRIKTFFTELWYKIKEFLTGLFVKVK